MQAPTLLIVGGEDDVVITLNEQAGALMQCEVKLEIVAGATHLFEEPGALERVAQLATDWFLHRTLQSAEAETSFVMSTEYASPARTRHL